MNDYSSLAKTLSESLKLRVPPVAVCFTDKPPERVPASTQPAAAGCVVWERGAKSAFVTSPADHSNCVVGMYTHHMPLTTAAQLENLDDLLKVFGVLVFLLRLPSGHLMVFMQGVIDVIFALLASTPV